MNDSDRNAILADMIKVKKAALWQEAKGKLRAMVAVEGQCSGSDPLHRDQRDRWLTGHNTIEAFIAAFEDDGLHE